MANRYGTSYIVDCKVGEKKVQIAPGDITRFEWKGMVSGGYIARITMKDPYFQYLDSIMEGEDDGPGAYFATGRQPSRVTLVEFSISYVGPSESGTKSAIGVISGMRAHGAGSAVGSFEFVAVDPISYFLNSGKCSGVSYTGKIGGDDGVLAQVFRDYVPATIGEYKTKLYVADTDDGINTYWMMRQDPRTFIRSLLDWSCSFTKHKTAWIISSGRATDDQVLVLDIDEAWVPHLTWPSGDGPLILNYDNSQVSDVSKWDLVMDNFLSALNLKLLTSGMSAVTGEYLDRVTDFKELTTYVKDENTAYKPNPRLTAKHSFTKPKAPNRGWTHIGAIPEVYSAGDMGSSYSRYIDGRARQRYMDMMNTLMRVRVTARGQPRLYDTRELAKTMVTLRWLKPSKDTGTAQPRFLDGDWLLYGWHHKATPARGWNTDVYLSRLDWDAASTGG